MKMNNYDAVAPFYDTLSRLVFGKAQVHAQAEQLKHIPASARILIVGGGTGWILEEITKIHAADLQITYVEISEQMLVMAKAKNTGSNELRFVHSAIEEFHTTGTFDLILTAFLFDNFAEQRVHQVFNRLDGFLEKGGLWFFCDFKLTHKRSYGWKQLLLKMMYVFFRIFARVEAKKLQEVEALFHAKNYQVISRKAYYRGFIESIIFRKSRNFHTFI